MRTLLLLHSIALDSTETMIRTLVLFGYFFSFFKSTYQASGCKLIQPDVLLLDAESEQGRRADRAR